MDDDEIDKQLNSIAVMAGFKDYEEMEDFRLSAQQGLIKFGGSFASNLGLTLRHADMGNTLRIINTFRDVLIEHEELWKQFLVNRNKT